MNIRSFDGPESKNLHWLSRKGGMLRSRSEESQAEVMSGLAATASFAFVLWTVRFSEHHSGRLRWTLSEMLEKESAKTKWGLAVMSCDASPFTLLHTLYPAIRPDWGGWQCGLSHSYLNQISCSINRRINSCTCACWYLLDIACSLRYQISCSRLVNSAACACYYLLDIDPSHGAQP